MADRRKDVLVYHYDKKKKFFLVTLELENVPGALGNLANVLGVRGINMMEGYFGGLSSGQSGTMSFFVESTNPKMDKDWLKDYIQSSVLVSNVEVKEGVEGFLADSINFPLAWNNGERAIVMRIETAQVMLDSVKTSGGQKGEERLYMAGFEHGKLAWQKIFSTFRPETKDGMAEMLNIISAVGWGRPELKTVDLKHKTAVIKLEDGFECMGVTSAGSYSNFLRGHLAGAVSAYFGTNMKAVETRCVARGDKYCEFELAPEITG